MSFQPPASLVAGSESVWKDCFLLYRDYLSNPHYERLNAFCVYDVPWRKELVSMFGKVHVARRRTCCYGTPGAMYRYRGSAQTPLTWDGPLLQLRDRLESDLGASFNFVLLNRYRNGGDHVGFHSDDERDLQSEPVIASISLGSSRTFRVRERNGGQSRDFDVSSGTLVLMWGPSQANYKHALLKTAKPVGERFNLSFRQVTS